MKKIPQENINFFEVEKQDQKLITKKIKKATLFAETFNSKIAKKCQNAEILCGMHNCEFSAKNLKNCPNLKLIVTRTVGYDHIDLKYAEQNNIKVCHVPDYGSHAIAEHVFALLLSAVRQVLQGEKRTEKVKFNAQGLRGIALKGKTLGVIGTGKIGMNVCRIASLGFLMDVIAYDVHPDRDRAREYHFKYVRNLNQIWKKADIITLHVPLFPSTKHLINSKTISEMKPGVVIINTARGELINTHDLIKGLKSGKISHAALDVVEHEKNIEKSKEILKLPGVIITPHIAYYADDTVEKMYEEAINSIKRFQKGEELIHQVKGI